MCDRVCVCDQCVCEIVCGKVPRVCVKCCVCVCCAVSAVCVCVCVSEVCVVCRLVSPMSCTLPLCAVCPVCLCVSVCVLVCGSVSPWMCTCRSRVCHVWVVRLSTDPPHVAGGR